MTRPSAFICVHLRLELCFAALALTGCGSIGDPLPPSLKIPERVADLAALERAERIEIAFTAPDRTTDGVLIKKLGGIDVRIGPIGPDWEEQAKRIPSPDDEPGPIRLDVPARDWAGREVEIRVRTAGGRGRFSAWSAPVRMHVVPPLETPTGLRAEPVPEGMRLTWTAPSRPGLGFRIFRRADKQNEPVPAGTADKPESTDTTTQYGTRYEYTVQSWMKAGEAEAVSEMSAPAIVTPVDKFPPATPAGLTATPGATAIQVTWNPNAESDLRGYYIFRSVAGGSFERLGDLLTTPNYADRQVETGKLYRYAVSAIDQSGNESPRTSPVEVTAP